ncbi:EYxxD motif small membrane protein [Halalkalibacter sp. APA_J-10(15)]
MFDFTEFALDSLFVYAMVIGTIVAIIYFFMKKRGAK